jgi:glycerol uptake facilitator protein
VLTRAKAAMLGAEFLGTALLATIILIMSNTTSVSYFIATSAAVVLAAIVMLFGSVSGAHVNPAVTFGMWTARKITTVRAVTYIAAQALGGLAAWQLFQYLTNHKLTSHAGSYNTRMLISEAIGAAVLSFGIAAVINRRADASAAALAIGTVFFGAIMVAALASAGYINPAVALAARSWSWVYVGGPLIGGLVGVNLYMFLFEPRANWGWNSSMLSMKTTSSKKKSSKK